MLLGWMDCVCYIQSSKHLLLWYKVVKLWCKVLFWFFDVFCWMLFEKHLGTKLVFMDHNNWNYGV